MTAMAMGVMAFMTWEAFMFFVAPPLTVVTVAVLLGLLYPRPVPGGKPAIAGLASAAIAAAAFGVAVLSPWWEVQRAESAGGDQWEAVYLGGGYGLVALVAVGAGVWALYTAAMQRKAPVLLLTFVAWMGIGVAWFGYTAEDSSTRVNAELGFGPKAITASAVALTVGMLLVAVTRVVQRLAAGLPPIGRWSRGTDGAPPIEG